MFKDKKRLLFVYNPRSGKAKMKYALLEIIDIFTKAGYIVTAVPTQYRRHAVKLVSGLAPSYDAVVCSGGDGTLTEAVGGIMSLPEEQRPPLGYIPSGTTNDVARSLGIARSMTAAAAQMVGGAVHSIDVGRLNGQYFTYCAAFGAFTEVTYMTPQEVKHLLGHQAYVLEGVRSIQDIRAIPVRVVLDDRQVIEEPVLFGMVTNSKSVGGFHGITGRNVCMDDGIFEVTLVPALSGAKWKDWTEMKNELVTRRPNKKLFHSYKARQIQFSFQEPVDWVYDGEYGGAQQEVSIQNLERSLKLILP